MSEHLHEGPYIGVLFITVAAACFALAVGLAIWDLPLAWALAGLTTTLAVVASVVSRTTGLPQVADEIGNWADPLGIAALSTEAPAH